MPIGTVACRWSLRPASKTAGPDEGRRDSHAEPVLGRQVGADACITFRDSIKVFEELHRISNHEPSGIRKRRRDHIKVEHHAATGKPRGTLLHPSLGTSRPASTQPTAGRLLPALPDPRSEQHQPHQPLNIEGPGTPRAACMRRQPRTFLPNRHAQQCQAAPPRRRHQDEPRSWGAFHWARGRP